jgi:hypothetical protein
LLRQRQAVAVAVSQQLIFVMVAALPYRPHSVEITHWAGRL